MTDLRQLVMEHGFAKALVIDDGYDEIPLYEDLNVDDPDLVTEALAGLRGPAEERLSSALREAGLGSSEYDRALENEEVIAELWALSEEGLLPDDVSQGLFDVFRGDQASKVGQLKALELFLDGLAIDYRKEGRSHGELGGANLVFLDLYLGVTNEAAALRQAKERIRRLVGGVAETARPVVVVMSTVTGPKLQELAHDLQRDAELLGCKFRVVSKPEFDAVLAPTLQQVLEDHPNATTVSEWIDMWDSTLEGARQKFVRDVRMLDLSDYAYLQKYRLEAEGMGLGSYLVPLLLDYLNYCAEDSRQLADSRARLNGMELAPFRRHLMPSQQTTVLAHARAFHNESFIEAEGTQFESPIASLELGDVVIKVEVTEGDQWPDLNSLPVSVVLSQACDIQQGKTDSYLMLSGTVRDRDWLANVAPVGLQTDVFIWHERQYLIDWEKAKSSAVSFAAAKGWLKKGGTHHRIARFRSVEALRLQQVFASNLTRVGTLVTPTSALPVEVRLHAKAAGEGYQELAAFSAASRMAALMSVREINEADAPRRPGATAKIKSKSALKLIFSDKFAGELINKLAAADLDLVDPSLRGNLDALKDATAELASFDQPIKTTEKLKLGGMTVPIYSKGAEPSKLPAIYFTIDTPAPHDVFGRNAAA